MGVQALVARVTERRSRLHGLERTQPMGRLPPAGDGARHYTRPAAETHPPLPGRTGQRPEPSLTSAGRMRNPPAVPPPGFLDAGAGGSPPTSTASARRWAVSPVPSRATT